MRKTFANGSVRTGGRRGSQLSDDEPVAVDNPHIAPPSEEVLEDLDSTSMSSSYSGEWEKLFMRPQYMRSLRSYGMKGKLRSSRFRSVCWKLYLEVLPENQHDWLSKTRYWRKRYTELKQRLIVNPRKSVEGSDLSLNNPLSQETESPWNQFFQDNELRLTIKQDVIRTFPEIQFFQNNHLHDKMSDILFCYAKGNHKLHYKQGMHELLAPMIFVLHCDHQAFLHACEIESVSEVPMGLSTLPAKNREIVKEVLDPRYIEHDAFAMFCQVMETVEPWYVSKEISPVIKSKGIFVSQPFARVQDLNPSNVIVTKLTRIQDYLLKKYDADLHGHLERMEIAPQIYGIRWVRLLFGREFPMQDLLVLWDALFADGISFDLVDYVFVAMLLYLRDALLSSDYPTCLTTLMKFPPVGDVHYFVEKALYLREPNEQPRPPNYTYQKPAMLTNGDTYQRLNKNASSIAASMMSGISTLTRRLNQSRPHTLTISPKKISKSTSEPMNLLTDESPVDYRPKDKRGSTASLSKLEDSDTGYARQNLRPTTSAQSLARLETTPGSMRSGDSSNSIARSDYLGTPEGTGSPGQKYTTLPGGRAKGTKGGKGQKAGGHPDNLQQGMSYLLGKLNDLEAMCRLCGSKMDIHIDKLQSEMLRQVMENEDELLLSLAGLKQVRDVLKGILKPSNLFDNDEIKIKENYYQSEGQGMMMSQSGATSDLTPGSVSSRDSPLTTPRLGASQLYPTSSSIDTSSDSSSPEYSDNNAGHRKPPPEGVEFVRGKPVPVMYSRELKSDIELIDLQTDSQSSHRSLSRQSSSGSAGAGTVSGPRSRGASGSPSTARRKHPEKNSQWTFGSRHHRMGAFSDSESAEMDTNQNTSWFKFRRRSEDGGMHYK